MPNIAIFSRPSLHCSPVSPSTVQFTFSSLFFSSFFPLSVIVRFGRRRALGVFIVSDTETVDGKCFGNRHRFPLLLIVGIWEKFEIIWRWAAATTTATSGGGTQSSHPRSLCKDSPQRFCRHRRQTCEWIYFGSRAMAWYTLPTKEIHTSACFVQSKLNVTSYMTIGHVAKNSFECVCVWRITE